tara:strand:- start:486 stop:1895 length:1410 start_codon:yes stop_codon:yes gene_type:complete
MSVDLNNYFNLGLESTNVPVTESGMVNIFRTPVDTSSANLNRITFKVPKSGLLTADSMLNLQFVLQDSTATDSQFTPNLVNGAIGAIKRTRILIDNKVLVDIQRPGLPEVVKLYSRNTQIELAEKQYKLFANQFRSTIDPNGFEIFDSSSTRYYTDQAKTSSSLDRNIILQEASSKVYGIPIKYLGAEFLDMASLPVFLLGEREMVIEIEFHSDSREYIVSPNATVAADTTKILLANCELVTTHIILPQAVEQNELAAMKRQPVSYPLLDTYLIKGSLDSSAATVGAVTGITNSNYRINFQNREVHNLLICPVDSVPGSSLILANQRSNSLGALDLQMKINGQNLFDRPVTNQSNIFQLTTYSENSRSLKVPLNGFRCDTQTIGNVLQSDQSFYLDYRGGLHYVKVDFSNANNGIFGSGTLMHQAAVIDYKTNMGTATNPNQAAVRDMFFYASISKMLTIGANTIGITF